MATNDDKALRRLRTLLFCTAYAPNEGTWNTRYRRWLEGILKGGLEYDQVLLIDDCSPVLPDWTDVAIVDADGAVANAPVAIVHFATHLGSERGHYRHDFPGWFRSYTYAAKYARSGSFEKIVHIEFDAFIISHAFITYINRLDSGWTGLWCARHNWQEASIQVIAGSSLVDFFTFCDRPYSEFDGKLMEAQYPFTNIEKSFVGDRYGEYRMDVPVDADYVTQARVAPDVPDHYYWWLNGKIVTGGIELDLDELYRSILDRPLDPPGAAHWARRLASDLSPDRLRAEIANSPEAQEKLTGVYTSHLGRAPEPAGLTHWTSRLASGVSFREVASDIASSDEARGLSAIRSAARD